MKIYRPSDLQDNNIAAACLRTGSPEQKTIWRIDAPCSIMTKGNEMVAIRIDGTDWQPYQMPNFDSYFEAKRCSTYDRRIPISNVKFEYWPAIFTFDIASTSLEVCLSGYEFHANEYIRGINGRILKGYVNRINARYIN